MKTKTLLVTAIMLAAGYSRITAQTNTYSDNVVGYVNVVFPGPSRYVAVANPLNTTNNKMVSVLKSIPANSQVLKWNHARVDYDIFNKVPFGGPWDGGIGADTTFNPGEGLMVRPGTLWTNTFVGEVLQGSLTNSFPSGFEMRASKVPQAGPVSALGFVPPNSSQFLKWDSSAGTIGDWAVFNRTPFGAWSPGEPSLEVGEPFLLRSPSAFDWIRNFTVP